MINKEQRYESYWRNRDTQIEKGHNFQVSPEGKTTGSDLFMSRLKAFFHHMEANGEVIDPWWVRYDRSAIPRRKYFTSSIFKHNPQSVLELGCCGGCNVMHFPMDTKTIGLDLNPLAIKYAKETKPWATFLEKDITLPFDFLEEPVDIICSMGVLIHIPTEYINSTLTNMLNSCRLGFVLMETVGPEKLINDRGTPEGPLFEMWYDIPKRVSEQAEANGHKVSVKVTKPPYKTKENLHLIEVLKLD